MSAIVVPLRFALDGSQLRLRELTGHDERHITGAGTGDALRLLDAVILALPGEDPPPRAEELVAADRDRALAAVYRQTFGDRIENTLHCERCRQPFDIDFSLRELASSVDERPHHPDFAPVGPNLFETAAGQRFRLPTGRDELAAVASGADAEASLVRRCQADSPLPLDAAVLATALDEVAPLLEFELRAACPECGWAQLVQFDIQTYLLRSLLNEQGQLSLDLHRLATAYGWRPDDVFLLARSERRQLVELIENAGSRRRILP